MPICRAVQLLANMTGDKVRLKRKKYSTLVIVSLHIYLKQSLTLTESIF